MPRSLKVLFLVCLIAGCMGAQTLPSSVVQTNSICGNHEAFTYGTMNCIDRFHFAWFASGAGWKSVMSFVNTTHTDIWINLELITPDGTYNLAFGSLIRVYGDIPSFLNNKVMSGTTIKLASGQAGEVELLYPQICSTILQCSLRPDQLQIGSVRATIQASNGQTLDEQVSDASQLIFTYSSPNTAVTTLQVPLKLVKDSTVGSRWEGNFTETPLAQKTTDPNRNTTSFAVLNMSVAQVILVEIIDADGTVIVSQTTPLLASGAVYGVGLTEFFGDHFPVQVQQDGVIHGRVRFTGLAGGGIFVFLPRSVGESLSAFPTWQVK